MGEKTYRCEAKDAGREQAYMFFNAGYDYDTARQECIDDYYNWVKDTYQYDDEDYDPDDDPDYEGYRFGICYADDMLSGFEEAWEELTEEAEEEEEDDEDEA